MVMNTDYMEDLKDKLKEEGLKLTPQRVVKRFMTR